MANKFLIKLDESKYDGSVQISTAGVEYVADNIYNKVLEGHVSPISIIEMFKFTEEVGNAVKGKADINGKNSFVDLVRAEIERESDNGKSCTSKYGTKLELAETGIKYDYTACEDPEWEDLNKEFEILKKKKSEREKFLQKIGEKGLTVVNEDTGEMKKIYQPIKTSTSSYKQTLSKE